MLIKCICTNCAGHLEFEEGNAGEQINCPHCGFQTKLFVPGTEEHDAPPLAALKRFKWRRWSWPAGAILGLAGVAFLLYRWGLPLVRGVLPESENVFLPYLVLALGCLLLPLVLAWAVLPVVLCLQIRTLIKVVSQIESDLRSMSPSVREEPEEQPADSEPEASEVAEN